MIGFSRVISGLRASEEALYVTGNNITNANTQGYKRQRVLQTEQVSASAQGYSVGLGVNLDSCVRQVYSDLKEGIYRDELAALGEYTSKNKVYSDLQTIIGDPMNEMLQGGMEDIWESANSLSKDATSLTYKISFRESALSFLEQVDNIGDQLASIQNEINDEIAGKIEDINNYAYEIKNLNEEIGYYQALNGDATELKDERSYIIEKLSSIINADVEESSDGFSLAVRVGSGYLVSSGRVYEMELAQNQEGSIYKIPKWVDSGANVNVNSGEIKGLLDARGFDIVGNLEDSSNGAPKEKADIVISIDPNMNPVKLANMQANIAAMLDSLDTQQSNYKLYINIMGTNTNQAFNDRQAFEDYIANNMDDLGTSSDILTSISSLDDIAFRGDSNKYLMVFSDTAVNGGAAVSSDTLETGVRELTSLGMTVIAVTDKNNDSVVNSWKTLTKETTGDIYDISNVDSDTGFEQIGLDLSRNINTRLDIDETTNIIPGLKSKFNALVNAMAKEFNAIFRKGTNADGEQHGVGGVNLDLFVKIDNNLPLQMGNITLNPAFNNINKLPTSLSGASGDGRLGEMLTALRDGKIFSDGLEDSTIDDYYAGIISSLGFDAEAVEVSLTNQEIIVNDAENNRKQISGVSLDQELANMVKYQYSYAAASKLMTIVDEMLEIIVQNL